MTYVIPNPPTFRNMFLIKIDKINIKTHKRFIIYNETYSYYKCEDCELEVHIEKRLIFPDNYYSSGNYSCNEYMIKNIIE